MENAKYDQELPNSSCQTKDWRKSQSWYINGKKNECEIYQRSVIEKHIGMSVPKTNKRIDLEHMTLTKINTPLRKRDGFKYTEDFDGIIKISDKEIYLNLKMICDSGGSQTRSIREVNHFIKGQYDCLCITNNKKTYFANIIDGDQGYKYIHSNFKKQKASLKDMSLWERYSGVKNYVFIGDLKEFLKWIDNLKD